MHAYSKEVTREMLRREALGFSVKLTFVSDGLELNTAVSHWF
jgi:hypothetical protein